MRVVYCRAGRTVGRDCPDLVGVEQERGVEGSSDGKEVDLDSLDETEAVGVVAAVAARTAVADCGVVARPMREANLPWDLEESCVRCSDCLKPETQLGERKEQTSSAEPRCGIAEGCSSGWLGATESS